MVWNVTKDDIKIRMAVTEEATWAPPLARPAEPPNPQDKVDFAKSIGLETIDFSDFTKAGFWDVDDVLKPIYEDAGKALGREFNYPDPTKKK